MSASPAPAMENVAARPDIREKVTGHARYTVDKQPRGMVWARYLRFPYGAGRIAGFNIDAARAVPGVLEVSVRADHPPRCAGDVIGEMVAESPAALDDGLAALRLQCRPGQPTTNPDDAHAGVPPPNDEEAATLKSIFADATVTVEAEYRTAVQTHSCFEPHAVTAIPQDNGDLEVAVSTQSLMSCQEQSARAADLPASRVRVKAEYVGGGFGSKFGIGAEGNLAIKWARELKRPCRVALSRQEEHEMGGNRPGSIQYYHLAAAADGRLLGGRMHLVSVVGHTGRGGGVRAPSYYRWGEIVRTDDQIALNSGLPRAFRAPAWPQASFAMESVLDELAARLGMDPVEFRIRNETSERRQRQLRQGAELIGWNERPPDGTMTGVVKTGWGCGVASWGNSQGRCAVDLDVYPSGHLEVRIGIQDMGTGATVLAVDVAAWHLGLDRKWITGKIGVSDYPPGPASGGSITSRFTAPAVRDAAEKAVTALKARIAAEWELAPNDVTYAQGVFRAADGRERSWVEACRTITDGKINVRGEFNDRYWGHGNSDTAQFAKVDVDTETGLIRVRKIVAIQACGLAVNRLTAENQIEGGVIQGMSYALFEDRRLDGPTGAQYNADLLQYKISGIGDLPEIVAIIDRDEEEDGVRSLGEPTTIPTAGAIANAVANAIGARVRELPITPARVLAALEERGSA